MDSVRERRHPHAPLSHRMLTLFVDSHPSQPESILLMISWTEILFEQTRMVNVFDMYSLGVNIFSCWTRARDKNLIWNSFYIFNLASFVCIIITHLVKGCLKTKWADNQHDYRCNYFIYVCWSMISRVMNISI